MALCALTAMGLAACGDDDDEETTTETTERVAPRASSTVTVDMTEMAYAVSGPLTSGGTIRLANRGREFHVAAMGKLKPGRTLADIETALREAGPPGGGEGGEQPTTSAGGATTTTARGAATTTTARGAATTTTAAGGAEGEGGGEEDNPLAEFADFVGPPGGFMSPGETADITVPNLGAGTYAFVCFIPSEGDGIPHFAKGMIGEMEVVEGRAPAPPTADATYKIAPGQPVEGPASLSAGRHTLKIEASAGSDQLEPGLARLNPGTTFTQLDNALSTLFEGEEGPPPGSASRVPGQIVYSALDLGSVNTFYLTADLRAGNYALLAEDTDPENRPRPPRELINITVG